MKQFTLRLQAKAQRPVIKLVDFYGFDALLDTGALFPVWIEDESILKELDAVLLMENVEFGGFGGKAIGNLYRIPMLKVGELLFPDFHMISCKLNLPCKMILSATMFDDLIYEVDNHNHRFNVSIPDTQSTVRNLVIEDQNGNLHVLCSSGNVS